MIKVNDCSPKLFFIKTNDIFRRNVLNLTARNNYIFTYLVMF